MEHDRSSTSYDAWSMPLAIIGLAFEFPQEATSVEAFWKMLCEGRSATTEFPRERLNINAFYHPDDSRPSSVSPLCHIKLNAKDPGFTARTDTGSRWKLCPRGIRRLRCPILLHHAVRSSMYRPTAPANARDSLLRSGRR